MHVILILHNMYIYSRLYTIYAIPYCIYVYFNKCLFYTICMYIVLYVYIVLYMYVVIYMYVKLYYMCKLYMFYEIAKLK